MPSGPPPVASFAISNIASFLPKVQDYKSGQTSGIYGFDNKEFATKSLFDAYNSTPNKNDKNLIFSKAEQLYKQSVDGIISNPLPFIQKQFETALLDYLGSLWQKKEDNPAAKQKVTDGVSALSKAGVSVDQIRSTISDKQQWVQQNIMSSAQMEGDSLASALLPIAAIALNVVAPGAGTAIGSALGASGAAATAIGNAIIGGTLAEASGGDFFQGALQGAGGALLGAATAPVTSAISEAVGSQALGQALVSGALAEAQGGDFLQGAIAGGISGLANEAKLDAAEEYLKSQPVDRTYESDLPTLNVESGDTIGIVEQPFIPDTSFTPDYSLSTGPSVIPDMGAQGIQVPTINEIIDVVNTPVDYSLPIPDSGLGFVMPSVPNLDSMGGGQGITVPVAGGTLTEAGVIPDSYIPALGDPESFINKPAPDSGVTISEPTEKPMTQEELESELAKTDLLKTAANLAAGALTAGAVVNAISGDQDAQTGFSIVPVPTDWTAPVYGNAQWQTPTPIDFGSAQLLEGTQWGSGNVQQPNQYSLSNLINTLNYQSQPFVQSNMDIPQVEMQMPDILSVFQTPNTVGLNDKIGNLNGTPMSIADIIAGIQSGQTYTI